MILPLYELKEEGLHRHPAWSNFITNILPRNDSRSQGDILRTEYNARRILANSVKDDYLIFDTEQDMMLFLLKWS